jgi:hypothetical protein
MPKYYKPKEKHDRNEAFNNKRKKLFFDKRVKSIVNCSACDTPITKNEAKRNGGLCDNCKLPF